MDISFDNGARHIRYSRQIRVRRRGGRVHEHGIGMIEAVLAMAIFGLIAASIVSMVVGSFRALEQGGEQSQAEALAQEGIESLRSIRDRAWNLNTFSQSATSIVASEWVFDGEATSETIGQFTRTITFADVCRDGSDDIVSCPGTYTDVHSKEVTVTVTWTIRTGITNTVQRVAYLTNWDSQEWTEDVTADFTDGTFSSSENSTTLGDADGAVTLQEL